MATVAAGHSRLIDIGVVNDRTFVNNGSIGAYPRLVWDRNRVRRRGVPRPLASVIAAVQAWRELRFASIRLTIDDVEQALRTPFVFIGNGKYEVEGVSLGRRSRLTDGKLSLYVARESGRLGVLSLPIRALLGTLKRYEKFEIWRASTIVIDSPQPRIAVALDGEVVVLNPPLQFSVRREALRVIVPADDGH